MQRQQQALLSDSPARSGEGSQRQALPDGAVGETPSEADQRRVADGVVEETPSDAERRMPDLRRLWEGTVVRKYFGDAAFNGQVAELWIDASGRPQARITYEDGDEEDLELWETLEIVKSKKRQRELSSDVDDVVVASLARLASVGALPLTHRQL